MATGPDDLRTPARGNQRQDASDAAPFCSSRVPEVKHEGLLF